jgi:5'-3' exonuclease
MSESRKRKRFFDPSGLSLEELAQHTEGLCQLQRDIPFWIGDIARYCKARWPDTWQQAFPEWASVGMVDRYAAVTKAYPDESDREFEATYTQYMRLANDPQRRQKLEAIVAEGLTSDESRTTKGFERAGTDSGQSARNRWLLAVDVHYYTCQYFHSGSGTRAASEVSQWIIRTYKRLEVSDCVCCFDSPRNFRIELTSHWEDRYKNRDQKPPELTQQLQTVRHMLEDAGLLCVSIDGYEADDIIASYAAQFDGKVTILAVDKDLRQCLVSGRCNMLIDNAWKEDPTSGDMVFDYKASTLNAEKHIKEGCSYNNHLVTGIRPDQWADFQALAGDPVDTVKGAKGIGAGTAEKLITEFGTLDAVIQAARDGDERLTESQRTSILTLPEEHPFAENADIVRQLVTLVTDLELPMETRV